MDELLLPPGASPDEVEQIRAPNRAPLRVQQGLTIARPGDVPKAMSGIARQARVIPRVNHGRWIVDCPFCPSAMDAVPPDSNYRPADGPLGPIPVARDLFVCDECGNAAANKRPCEVAWPSKGERQRVQQILTVRPVENRNWRPGETVGGLEAENVQHGLEPRAPKGLNLRRLFGGR